MSERSRTVVVTGGASGIGDAVVQAFRASGDEVFVVDRQPSTRDVRTVQGDLTDTASIHAAVGALPDGIDVLVNAAGVSGIQDVRTILAVNYTGAAVLTELLAPRFSADAAVVSVASTAGYEWRDRVEAIEGLLGTTTVQEAVDCATPYLPKGRESYEAYNLSKAALIVWSMTKSRQFGPNIRTNTVSPGPIETPLLAEFYDSMGSAQLDPLKDMTGRHGTAQEVAAVITFLAGTAASWISGTDTVVDGGAEGALLAAKLASQNRPTTRAAQ